MKGILSRILVPLVLLSVISCSDEPTGPGRIDSIRLTPNSPIIAIGDTTRISITGTRPDGEPATTGTRLRSLDPAVAMVNGSGVVIGIGQGTARITGGTGGATDTARVTVIPARFNVQTEDGKQCNSPDYRQGRVVAVSRHAIVVADTANPSGGFSTAEYQAIAETFDRDIHPVVTSFFGEPADIDDNDRVIIFYTRAVNELTPMGSAGYVAGFFHTRDLFPRSARGRLQGCSTSNEAEIFYLLVPDPDGEINNNRHGREKVSETTLATMAHEYQHLINASRRLYINDAADFEDIWLNEGLSHIAEELLFYHTSGLEPLQNITINMLRTSQARVNSFNAYQIHNLNRLSSYLIATDLHSAYSDQARLGDRGAVWHFLRYLADRVGISEPELWTRITNSKVTGLENLREAIGQDPMPLYRDWAITLFTDDLVPNTSPIYQQPSWNYRSVIQALSPSQLHPRPLRGGTPNTYSLRGGASTYHRFTVPSGQEAEVRIGSGTAGEPLAPGDCSPALPRLDLAVGEVDAAGSAAASRTLCIAAGSAEREYVVVTTNVEAATTSEQVTAAGFGINQSVAQSPPIQRSPHSIVTRMGPAPEPARLDYSVHDRIRRQEALLLNGLSKGAPVSRGDLLFQETMETGPSLYVSLIRTR